MSQQLRCIFSLTLLRFGWCWDLFWFKSRQGLAVLLVLAHAAR